MIATSILRQYLVILVVAVVVAVIVVGLLLVEVLRLPVARDIGRECHGYIYIDDSAGSGFEVQGS